MVKDMETRPENLHFLLAGDQNIQLQGETLPAPISLVDGGLVLGMCYYENTGGYYFLFFLF